MPSSDFTLFPDSYSRKYLLCRTLERSPRLLPLSIEPEPASWYADGICTAVCAAAGPNRCGAPFLFLEADLAKKRSSKTDKVVRTPEPVFGVQPCRCLVAVWRAMPDLTFSEIAIDRNVLGKSASSETWLDGVVISKAEATRRRVPNVPSSQAEAVAAAAAARGKSSYDAGHWYWQPVGGRAVRIALLPTRGARRCTLRTQV